MEAILKNDAVLVLIEPKPHSDTEFLKSNFAGKVELNIPSEVKSVIFFGGNVKSLIPIDSNDVFIIEELSYNVDAIEPRNLVNLGQVPIAMHGVGIFFRQFFDPKRNLYDAVLQEHKFQNLTESNKQSSAFRTGLYLSEVTISNDEKMYFNLLRCSSNFSGHRKLSQD